MQIHLLSSVPISGRPYQRQYIQDTSPEVPLSRAGGRRQKMSSQSTGIIFHLCCHIFVLPVLFDVKDNTFLLEKSISSIVTWN